MVQVLGLMCFQPKFWVLVGVGYGTEGGCCGLVAANMLVTYCVLRVNYIGYILPSFPFWRRFRQFNLFPLQIGLHVFGGLMG